MTLEAKELATIGAITFAGVPLVGSRISDADTGLHHDWIRRTSLALLKHSDVELAEVVAREPGAMMALSSQLVLSVEFYEKSCEAMNTMFARIVAAAARCVLTQEAAVSEATTNRPV